MLLLLITLLTASWLTSREGRAEKKATAALCCCITQHAMVRLFGMIEGLCLAPPRSLVHALWSGRPLNTIQEARIGRVGAP
jgi:hypothetical protein